METRLHLPAHAGVGGSHVAVITEFGTSPIPGAVRDQPHRPEDIVLYRLAEPQVPASQRQLAEREEVPATTLNPV